MLTLDKRKINQETNSNSQVIVKPKMRLSVSDPSGRRISLQKVTLTTHSPSSFDPIAKKTDKLLGIEYSLGSDETEQKKIDNTIYHYIFLIDISGSMQGRNEKLVKDCIRSIWDRMQRCPDNSRITFIGFNDEVKRISTLAKLEDLKKQGLYSLFTQLISRGGTRIDKAIEEVLTIHEIGIKENLHTLDQIFLFTDGQNGAGAKSTEELKQLFQLKGCPLNVTCLGIGNEYDEKYVVGLLDGTPWFHVKSIQDTILDGAILSEQLMINPVSVSLNLEYSGIKSETLAETKSILNTPNQLFLEYDQLIKQGLSEDLIQAAFEAESIHFEVLVNQSAAIPMSEILLSKEIGFYSPSLLSYFRAKTAELDKAYILNSNRLDAESTACVYRLFRQIPYTVIGDYESISQDKFGISENHPHSTFLGCKPNTDKDYCELRRGLFSFLTETRTREAASSYLTSTSSGSGFHTQISHSSRRRKNLEVLNEAEVGIVDPVTLDDFTDLEGKKFAVPYVVLGCDKETGISTLLPHRLSRPTIEQLKKGSGIENLPLSPYAQGNPVYLVASVRDEPLTNYLKGRTTKEILVDNGLVAMLPTNLRQSGNPVSWGASFSATLRSTLTLFKKGNVALDPQETTSTPGPR